MTISEILNELTPYTGHFPMQAMKAAIEQREAITPELLRVLEDVANDPLAFAGRKDYMLHAFAMYLLAQFRERRAYRPMVRMFSAPGETPFDLAGDTVTEALNRLLGSVYDGDPGPLQGMVEDDNVNEYVRTAALDAFLVLVDSGQMLREDVVSYYRSLFEGKLKRTLSYAWTGLVCSVADLPAPELLEEVRQAFADGLIDEMQASLDGIERDLQHPDRRYRGHFQLITDAIAEMEWWAAFDMDKRPKKRWPSPALLAQAAMASYQPPPPPPRAPPQPPMRVVKIGRNAPCPCGSGKKYKKCCGKS